MKYIALFLTITVLVGLAQAADRQLDVTWNPDCKSKECSDPDENGSYNNLVYVRLTGDKDIVHILYSNIDSFTILLFRTNLNVNVNVNWTNLLSKNATLMSNSIGISEKPLEAAGYVFPIIYEFEDTDGSADMTKSNKTFAHKTSDLIWKKYDSNETSEGTFEGYNNHTNGSFKFFIRYPGKDQRDKSLPHLLLNPESSSIDFIIDSVDAQSNSSKFAINTVILSDKTDLSVSSKRTIDDEYTPGTFKLWSAQTAESFLQWKPIFYYYSPKTLENSTITKQYDYKQNDSPTNGIGLCYFNPDKLFPAINISFGLQGNAKDGYYYQQTNYSSFSFAVGMGTAPNEKMSSVVTLVIIVGFGLPALVILVGLVVMVVKKIKRSNTTEFSPL